MPRALTRVSLRLMLPLLVTTVALMSPAPARACNPPPWLQCIEYTEFNWITCQCECPTQDCCDFYQNARPECPIQ
jgi:hypothetical protein